MTNNADVDLERLVADVVVAKLAVWDPEVDESVIDRPIPEIQLDSLDSLEMTQELERRLGVRADQETVAGFTTLRDYVPYLQRLVEGR